MELVNLNVTLIRSKGVAYGIVMVDLLKLLSEMVVHACGDGELVYKRGVDKSIVDLLAKRYNTRSNYSALAIDIQRHSR